MEEKKHPLFARFFENTSFGVAVRPGQYHTVSLYDSESRCTVCVEVPNEWRETPDIEDPEF
jgi:hypothetical protein